MKRAGQQTLLSFYKKRNVETSAANGAGTDSDDASRKSTAGITAVELKEDNSPSKKIKSANQTEINASSDLNVISSRNEELSDNPDNAAAKLPASAGALITSSTSENEEIIEDWLNSLSPELRELLSNEIENIGESWLAKLYPELTKPYFKSLKEFLKLQEAAKKTIFPPKPDIYSWSKLCRLSDVKVVILGQDPYHNHNQAHGLAFSVLPPTAIPPSLRNIYKELGNCFPDYKKPTSGLLTPWAKQGVLLLNACLTVEAHKANSHANKGWETFTERVLELVARNKKVVFMAWGTPAFKRISKICPDKRHLVLKSVHPSPLSASRGWFGSKHFTQANDWLEDNGLPRIDWQV